ncbi:hypothetical protein CEXT_243411 [Caerostris extrusa]|uniref:Uncharacterized protein n=1 Tax=Caerostris extrusa TaxID=172846 RepID=A0AAV4TSD6_CAEEX|nr:hypothetical protein CEXT_243411 [Caerostris extrusa]
MDIGCEGGHISTSDLLKLFPDIKKVIAIDVCLASEFYENPKIEYHVADITKSKKIEILKVFIRTIIITVWNKSPETRLVILCDSILFKLFVMIENVTANKQDKLFGDQLKRPL